MVWNHSVRPPKGLADVIYNPLHAYDRVHSRSQYWPEASGLLAAGHARARRLEPLLPSCSTSSRRRPAEALGELWRREGASGVVASRATAPWSQLSSAYHERREIPALSMRLSRAGARAAGEDPQLYKELYAVAGRATWVRPRPLLPPRRCCCRADAAETARLGRARDGRRHRPGRPGRQPARRAQPAQSRDSTSHRGATLRQCSPCLMRSAAITLLRRSSRPFCLPITLRHLQNTRGRAP